MQQLFRSALNFPAHLAIYSRLAVNIYMMRCVACICRIHLCLLMNITHLNQKNLHFGMKIDYAYRRKYDWTNMIITIIPPASIIYSIYRAFKGLDNYKLQ